MQFYYKSLKSTLLNLKSHNSGLDLLENLIQVFNRINKVYGRPLLRVNKLAKHQKKKKQIMINFLKQFIIKTKKKLNKIFINSKHENLFLICLILVIKQNNKAIIRNFFIVLILILIYNKKKNKVTKIKKKKSK